VVLLLLRQGTEKKVFNVYLGKIQFFRLMIQDTWFKCNLLLKLAQSAPSNEPVAITVHHRQGSRSRTLSKAT